MIETNTHVKPIFVETVSLDASNGAELWAKYEGSFDYKISLNEDLSDYWIYDEDAIEEAIEFFTLLRNDLIKRRAG
jgi:hypothetical protein